MSGNIPCHCLECGGYTTTHGRQLCKNCWYIHHQAGTLEQFTAWANALAKYEDYLMLVARGLSQSKIAERIGVSKRHVSRYEAHRAGRVIMKSLERNNK